MAVSIISLEKIKLGNINQWISIRSKNNDNPILLYLHGGPGTPVMPLFRHFQAPLEDYFIVVQWDQRGAGKSFSWRIPKESMTIEQFISDLYELIVSLCKRFNKEKIFLMGHSWGSVLGIKTVQKYPQLFHAYVGVSQSSNIVETEKIMYQFALKTSDELGDKKAVKMLKKIGPPFIGMRLPYDDFYKGGYFSKMRVYGLVTKYGGLIYNFKGYRSYFFRYLPLLKPEYTVFDLIRIMQGSFFSTKTMIKELLTVNLSEQVTEVKVPVYFLMGRHDYNCSAELAKIYFDVLKAPKKEFVWFEKSAHAPNGEEPVKFNKIMIDKVLPVTFEV
ncbi:MAG: alpha/beta hydrolase [Candidatus Thermoplasmatota archaeon]|nr:alpha/beta hydrolase [Candidatus Thermoplasmatota archaeon]